MEGEEKKRLDIDPKDALLSAGKTCEVLSTSKTTLWRMHRKDILKARRLGGKVVYLRSEVEALIDGLPLSDAVRKGW